MVTLTVGVRAVLLLIMYFKTFEIGKIIGVRMFFFRVCTIYIQKGVYNRMFIEIV